MTPMRIITDPPPSLGVFSNDLELVIVVRENANPEVFVPEGTPAPDRHLVLGLVQSAVVCVEERDAETVVSREYRTIRLFQPGKTIDLSAALVIGKAGNGRFGVLVRGDWKQARQLARQGLRWFTGTVRLDVP